MECSVVRWNVMHTMQCTILQALTNHGLWIHECRLFWTSIVYRSDEHFFLHGKNWSSKHNSTHSKMEDFPPVQVCDGAGHGIPKPYYAEEALCGVSACCSSYEWFPAAVTRRIFMVSINIAIISQRHLILISYPYLFGCVWCTTNK